MTTDAGAMTDRQIAAARDAGALAILPIGAVEQHGPHLPVDTDAVAARAVAQAAAQAMPAPGALVFPVLSYGYSPHHLGRPGTVSLSLEGVLGQVREAVGCLLASGFPRVALVNGHGGNSALLRAAVSDMACRGAPVTSVDYWEPSRARWSGLLRGRFASVGHACEFETALRMALEGPEAAAAIAARAAGLPPRLDQPFVAPGGIDGFTPAGAVAPPIFGAQDCGYYGDPAAARRETGAALLPVLAEGLAGFLTWFAGADLVLGRR